MLTKTKYSIIFSSLLFLPFTSLMATHHNEESHASCSAEDFGNCGNGVGPALTSGDSLKTSVLQLNSNTRSRNSDENIALLTTDSGHSAGDGFSNWSVWGSYNNSSFDSDLPLNNALNGNGGTISEASYDADSYGFTVGADTLISSRFLAGLALGYENNDISTAYNGGDNESSGFTLSPYAAYLINDNFSVDVAAGYSSLDYDTDRIDNSNGSTIRGSFDSKRWFVASNLNASFNHQNWFFSGRVGYMHMEERQDAYSESAAPTTRSMRERRITLSQFITGIDVAYSVNSFEPYITASYVHDISRDEGEDAGGLPGNVNVTRDDDDEVQYGLGVRYFGNDVSGTFEWSKTVGRANFNSNVWMLTLRTNL